MEGQFQKDILIEDLVQQLDRQIENSILQLKNADQSALFDTREVGRAKLPSTVFGLIFHAAEHTMRHVGQMLVTIKILQENKKDGNSAPIAPGE